MILTPELKDHIVKLMEDYWSSYISGDIESFSKFLVPDYRNIGTTKEEYWEDREALLNYTKDILPQMAGKIEMRNMRRKVIAMAPHVMVEEIADLYVMTDVEWSYYSEIRLSTVLKNVEGQWKVWHQHGSYPDARAFDGEAFGLDQLKTENRRLRAAVEERTHELVLQSRELEIEAALERVRSRSMGMDHSEELKDVIQVIFDQLSQLNVNSEHAGIVIDYEHHNDWHFWVAETQDIPSRISVPYLDLPWDRQFAEAKQKGEGFFTTLLNFEEKNNFYKTLLAHIPAMTDETREFYFKCEGLAISTTIEDDIGLYIENFVGVPFSEEENNILQRFGKVFQQTYTRFLDLQRAEEQGREAQIEAALERVRNRAISMRSSEELNDLVVTVFHELSGLDMVLTRCLLWIFNTEDNSATAWMTNSEDPNVADSYFVPYHEHEAYKSFLEAWNTRNPKWEYVLEGQGKEDWDEILVYGYFGSLPEPIKEAMKEPDKVILSGSFDTFGTIQTASLDTLSEENLDILLRFSQVFEQSYTRFKDLVKAEAQAREAQIELSLERIRARVTAMQESSDILDIVVAMRDEFVQLGHEAHYFWHMRWHPDTYAKAMTSGDGTRIGMIMDLPRHIHGDIPLLSTWEKSNEPLVIYAMNAEEAIDYVDKMVHLGDFKQIDPNAPSHDDIRHIGGLTFIMARTSLGEIGYSLPGPVPNPPEEALQVLIRFAGVFDLAHRRFEDLKKAEQKNRETEIELALERVRSSAMAMRNSEELHDILSVFFEQFDLLGISPVHCTLSIIDVEANSAEFIMTGKGGQRVIAKQEVQLDAMEEWGDMVTQWKNSTPNSIHDPFYPPELLPKVWGVFEDVLSQLPPEARIHPSDFPDGMYFCEGNYDYGYIGFGHTRPPTDEERQIVTRFATEFSRLYRRFLDLETAEAQAKEARIEAALERVRSEGMAMHQMSDLLKVVKMLSTQLYSMDLEIDGGAFIFVNEDIEDKLLVWGASGVTGNVTQTEIPYYNAPIYTNVIEAVNTQKGLYTEWYPREEKVKFFQHLFAAAPYDSLPDERKTELLEFEGGYTRSLAIGEHTSLLIINHSGRMFSDSENTILLRFQNVFEQTYVRFLDLKQAEERSREAQVETALEKVRSRTMGMQRSHELTEVTNLLFRQVRQLDIHAWSAGYCLWDDDMQGLTLYMSSEDVSQPPLWAPLDEDDSFRNFKAAYERGESFWVGDIGGQEIIDHYKYMYKLTGVGEVLDSIQNEGHSLPSYQVYHCVYFEHGFLLFITYEQVPESHSIFKRFGKVFDQTYTRFLDLKLAESQAYQAQIETALERVRARALAMHEPEELKQVADVMRAEMGSLGVEELETSSIYIYDKETGTTECWYALKDIRDNSKGMVSDYFELHLKDTWVGREMLAFYKNPEERVSILMTGENRIEWINYCEKHSPMIKGYYGEDIPDRTYHLYKFSHGAIGAASAGDISEESWELLQRAASVFSLAYSRFKDLTQARIDLQHLKEEKQRAEIALQDLREAQTQLVHAEKMASLGELTAGIAHEIKNPLNFVNNFSEVSRELLDEMHEAMSKGDVEEVNELVTFIQQNLEKITNHGKRADAIVKSMLQHSRSSDGDRESTDMNTLVDEYLRLAYHGLRAKDKSFNAEFALKTADDLPEIMVARQDIGRVVLNMINNAFYAVDQKKKKQVPDFKPKVIVSTAMKGNSIEIRVNDNGEGMPIAVQKKIFQPFFTTKPTGKGTGLGLSLSYDIVKAHGGEISVESEIGNGTEFLISLPVERASN